MSVSSRQVLRVRGCWDVLFTFCRGWDDCCAVLAEDFWEGSPEWVRAPYVKMQCWSWTLFPSSSEPVKFAVNLAGPPVKPKYYLMTDSGQVP